MLGDPNILGREPAALPPPLPMPSPDPLPAAANSLSPPPPPYFDEGWEKVLQKHAPGITTARAGGPALGCSSNDLPQQVIEHQSLSTGLVAPETLRNTEAKQGNASYAACDAKQDRSLQVERCKYYVAKQRYGPEKYK